MRSYWGGGEEGGRAVTTYVLKIFSILIFKYSKYLTVTYCTVPKFAIVVKIGNEPFINPNVRTLKKILVF